MRSALAFGLLLAAGQALAGSEITIETRKAGAPPEAKPQRSVVEVEGRSLRAEAGDGRHGAIWRGEEGVLQILDHAEQSIFRIDRATARSLSQQVDGAREGIRGQIGGLPEAQRETVERWIGGAPPAHVELRNNGKNAQVNGVTCRLLEALRDGVRLAEICEGPRGAAGVTPEALRPARELAAFLAEVGDLLPRSLGADGLEALVLVQQVEGVPLRVRAWPKGSAATEARIVSARPLSPAPERFQPPPGYEPGIGVHVGKVR
jgi:hypothetical protein